MTNGAQSLARIAAPHGFIRKPWNSATLSSGAPSRGHGSASYRPGDRHSIHSQFKLSKRMVQLGIHLKEEQPSFRQSEAAKSTSAARSLPPSPSRVGRLVARFLGREPKIVTAAPRPDSSKEQASGAPIIPRMTYNADEYNWSGFSCPYCSACSFVCCGGCSRFACDGSSELRNGQKFYQCFCGHAGFIQGTIKTVESKRLSVGEKLEVPNPLRTDQHSVAKQPNDAALPTSRPKGGLPVK